MAPTLVEMILAQKVQRSVEPGEVIEVAVDMVMVHDANAPLLFKYFSDDDTIFDPDKVVFVTDHFSPPSTPEHASMVAGCRDFVEQYGIRYHHEFSGICHQLMVDEGYVVPGMVAIGIDSHATTYGAVGAMGTGMGSTDTAYILKTGRTWLRVPETILVNLAGEKDSEILGTDMALGLLEIFGEDGAIYKALQFSGHGMGALDMDARMTISNFSHEMGAKAGIFPVDDVTRDFLHYRARSDYDIMKVDDNAIYEKSVEIDIGMMEPKIALPHSPANVRNTIDVEGKTIHQAFIGSCAGGRMGDLRAAAGIIEGKKVHEDVRLLVVPASNGIFKQALDEGLISTFVQSGAVVYNPSCGPCAGIDKGILGDKERCISTSNRNFKGRMGAGSSEIYLASAATVAQSAIDGVIRAPFTRRTS